MAIPIGRRELVLALGGVTAAWPLAVDAHESSPPLAVIFVIGIGVTLLLFGPMPEAWLANTVRLNASTTSPFRHQRAIPAGRFHAD